MTFNTTEDESHKVTAAELLQFIERWERLDAEKKDIAEQQKEVMAEARSRGYDCARIKDVIKLRAMDPDDRAEKEAVTQMYSEAVGL